MRAIVPQNKQVIRCFDSEDSSFGGFFPLKFNGIHGLTGVWDALADLPKFGTG